MGVLQPDAYYVSVLDIDPHDLHERGYRAVLLDLDNTLLPRGGEALSDDVVAWVRSLLGAGLSVALVTNTAGERASKAASTLGVPLVGNALKPLSRGILRACARLGVPCSVAVMVGDQSYTDILGAHRLGMDALMVDSHGGKDPLHTHFLRLVDRWAVRGMRAVGGAS